MNILVSSHHYRTEPIGIGAFTGEMCEWLAGRAHRVRVVAPPPHYPQWAVLPPYKQWKYQSETIDKVTVKRCPVWIPSNPRGWRRMFSQLTFAVSSIPAIFAELCRRPDVALVIEPSFLDTVVCLFLAKCFNTVCWLHIQDFEIEIAFALGQFRSSRLRSLIERFESFIMTRFDVVSTISERMREKVKARGVEPSRTVLFPNWTNTGSIYPLTGGSPLRRELEISEDKVIALFSGTLGTKQAVEVIVDSAALLKGQENIEFLICGNGPAVKPLEARAQGLRNIRFLPLQPLDRLNEMLNVADIHLLPQKVEVADLVMPSKLLNMLASGRPVISGVNPGTEVARVVSQCGLVVEPENPAKMAQAILRLAENRAERLKLGQAARVFATTYLSHSSVLEQFEADLYQCIDKQAGLLPLPISKSERQLASRSVHTDSRSLIEDKTAL